MTIKLPNGQYVVVFDRPLGKEGGFGAVYEGWDDGGFPVAIKQLKLDANELSGRELEISDSLKSRAPLHAMPVIDAGQDADSDRIYIVMPRAEYDLQTHIERNGVIGVPQCAAVMLQIARGLLEVRDIVHRDLKPANVLFYDGTWRVADFGIAKFVADATASKTLKGYLSEEYAAPEQWDNETATNATDVYALGCIAHFLLTGNPPFRESFEEAHRKSAPPPLPSADQRLKGLVGHMLRKRQDTRPSLDQVILTLTSVVQKPLDEPVFSELAAAGAEVAAKENARLANERAVEQAVKDRAGRFHDALDELANIQLRLYDRISSIASTAQALKTPQEACMIEIHFGQSTLGISGHRPGGPIRQNEFLRSGWDLVAQGRIWIKQEQPALEWGASLWFAKIDSQPHRWYEASYFSPQDLGTLGKGRPRIAASFQEADGAMVASTLQCTLVYLPCAIDGDQEGDFQKRWISLVSRAGLGTLRIPEKLPWAQWPFPVA